MANRRNPNLDILESTVDQLGQLADELVFVGGCATGLLLTDPVVHELPGHGFADMTATESRPLLCNQERR